MQWQKFLKARQFLSLVLQLQDLETLLPYTDLLPAAADSEVELDSQKGYLLADDTSGVSRWFKHARICSDQNLGFPSVSASLLLLGDCTSLTKVCQRHETLPVRYCSLPFDGMGQNLRYHAFTCIYNTAQIGG